MNNQWFSKVAVWLVIALVLFTVFKQFDRGVTQGNQIGYSDFLEEVRNNRIKSVTLQESAGGGTEIIALTNDDQANLTFTVNIPNRPTLTGDMAVLVAIDSDANPSSGSSDSSSSSPSSGSDSSSGTKPAPASTSTPSPSPPST